MNSGNSDIISESNLEMVVQQQLNIYKHLQNQSLSILRTLIAAGAFLAVALSAIGFTRVTQFVISFDPSPAYEQAAEDIETVPSLISAFVGFHVISGLLLIFSAITILILSIIKLLSVLGVNKISPVTTESGFHLISDDSVDIEHPVQGQESHSVDKRTYSGWVNNNNRILNQLQMKLRAGQVYLAISLFLLIFGSVTFSTGHYVMPELVLYISLSTIIPIVLIYAIKLFQLGLSLNSEKYDTPHFVPRPDWDISNDIPFLMVATIPILLAITLQVLALIYWFVRIEGGLLV